LSIEIFAYNMGFIPFFVGFMGLTKKIWYKMIKLKNIADLMTIS